MAMTVRLQSDTFMGRMDRWVKRFSNNAELMSCFRLCDKDAERFRLVWDFLRKVQPNTILIAGEDSEKSASEAERIRDMAWAQLKEGNEERATFLINTALVRSPWPSSKEDFKSDLLYGLEKRLEMFTQMEKFDECVQDVNNIVSLGLADRPQVKLLLVQKVEALRLGVRFKEAVECVEKEFVLHGLYPDGFWTEDSKGDETWEELKNVRQLCLDDLSHEADVRDAPVAQLAATKEKLKEMTPKDGFHPVFKSASTLVELKHTADVGRHLVATGDFNTGDVVMAEPPFVSCVQRAKWVTHCTACTMATSTPIPCRNCSLVVFCSADCSSGPKGQLHDKECKLLPIISTCEKDPGTLNRSALRRILVLRTLLMKTADEWRAYAARSPGNIPGEADQFEGIPDAGKYEWDDYDNVFCLVKNTKKKDPVELLRETFNACFIIKVMEEEGYFSDLDMELRSSLGGLALHHLLNYATNGQETWDYLTRVKQSNNLPKFDAVAYGVYPTYALCNYSCFPNLYLSFHGDVMVVRARRPIKKGDVLFARAVSQEFLISPFEIRQEFLETNHHFICECPACVNDWPLRREIFDELEELYPVRMVKCVQCFNVLGDLDSFLDYYKGYYAFNGYGVIGGYDFSVGSYDISIGGYDTSIGGYDTSIGGYNISIGGYDTSIGGYDTSIGGYNISIGGYDTSIGGYDISTDSYNISIDGNIQPNAIDSHVQLDTIDGHVQPNAINGHVQPDAINGHIQPNAIDGHIQPDTIDDGHVQPEAIDGHIQPDAIDSHIQPDAIDSHIQPDAIDSHIQPDAIDSHVQPNAINGHVQPDAINGHIQPNAIDGHIQPDTIDGHVQPKAINGHVQPNAMDGHVQPDAIDSHVQPDAIDGHVQPNAIHGHVQPDTIDGHLQPNAIDGHVQPNAIDGHVQPNAIDGHVQPDAFDGHVQPDAINGYIQPNVINRYIQPDVINHHDVLYDYSSNAYDVVCPTCGVIIDMDDIYRRIIELEMTPAICLTGNVLYKMADEAWALYDYPCSTIVEYEWQSMFQLSAEGNTFHMPEYWPFAKVDRKTNASGETQLVVYANRALVPVTPQSG